MKTSKKIMNNLTSAIMTGILLFFVFISLWSQVQKSFFKKNQIEKEISKIEKEIFRVEKETEKYTFLISNIYSEYEVEKVARNNLNMVKDGEVIFQFVEE